MNTMSMAALPFLIHASVVVSATLLMRVCVPRRFATSRAVVGEVGMASILIVTTLVFLPRIHIGSETDSQGSENSEHVRMGVPMRESMGESVSSPHRVNSDPATGIHFPLALLRRVGDRLDAVGTTAVLGIWRNLLVILMMSGIGLGVVRLVVALVGLRRLSQSSRTITDERAWTLVSEFTLRCSYRRRLELRESKDRTSAATFGILRPTILLPVGWREWSDDELAAVLAHEVAHIRRGDFLQRLIAKLCEILHFYHPLVRIMARGLAVDQEIAADRLATGFRSGAQWYVRGLAKLALRFDDSFRDDRSWSNVSIMPKSSDFLEWRLTMLRTRSGLPGKRTGWMVSSCAAVSVIMVAAATTLLRGAAPVVDPAASQAAPLESAPQGQTRNTAAQAPSGHQSDTDLFVRAPFDPSIIPSAEDGAFLIRVGELARRPEMRPYVDELSHSLTDRLREGTGEKHVSIDLRQVEWVAGVVQAKVRGNGDNSHLLLGANPIVIRMTHARNWQDVVLKEMSGAVLKTFEKRTYVQLPRFPALGPTGCKLQFPDEKTIVVNCSTSFIEGEQSEKRFVDAKSGQKAYAWADAWRAVDGGLITVVFDNNKIGWANLPKEKRDWPDFTAPLYEKVKYVAVGWDFTEVSKLTGIRIRGTCTDQEAVKDLQLASSMLLNRWPDLCQADDEDFVKHHARILQLLSSVMIEPSRAKNDQLFVQVSAEVTLADPEVFGILNSLFK